MGEKIIDPSTGLATDFSGMMFGTDIIDYTPADADLPGAAKAVFFDADGTCTIKPRGGGAAIAGVPFSRGNPLLFVPGRITAMAGPAKCFLVTGG